ncbi:MAG: hypothetical protein M5U34_13795 [Chloroflexi bacterium]|nr:hypothetical protein [Chloroflexota bacterium]
MHVALLANLQKNAPVFAQYAPDMWDDLDSEFTINAITEALESGGHQVTFLEGDPTLFDNLRQIKPDICFNICEGHFGDARESQVPAILEMLAHTLHRFTSSYPGPDPGQTHDQAHPHLPRFAHPALPGF